MRIALSLLAAAVVALLQSWSLGLVDSAARGRGIRSAGVDSEMPADDANQELGGQRDDRSEARTIEDSPPGESLPVEGSFAGRVLDPTGAPVASVRLLVTGAHDRTWSQTTASDGSFRFEGLTLGDELGVGVDGRTLPEGLQAPAQVYAALTTPRYGKRWPFGVFATIVEPIAEKPHVERDVELSYPAEVFGRVVRAHDHAPLTSSTLDFRPWTTGAAKPLGAKFKVDSEGRFRCRLSPGRFRVHVLHYSGQPEDPNRDLACVAPFSFSLDPGEQRDLGDLLVGGDGPTIVGRVVDQYGAPVPDLEVLLYLGADTEPGEPPIMQSAILCLSRTDVDGVYEARGLPQSLVKILAGAHDYESDPRNVTGERLTTWPETITVDLRGISEEARAPEVVVRISEPFRVEYNFNADAVSGKPLDEVWVTIDLLDGEGLKDRSLLVPESFNLRGKKDAIVWTCPTPHPPVVLRVTAEDERLLYETVLVPAPNGTLTEDVDLVP